MSGETRWEEEEEEAKEVSGRAEVDAICRSSSSRKPVLPGRFRFQSWIEWIVSEHSAGKGDV